MLNDRLAHGHAPPVRAGPLNFLISPLGLGSTRHVFRCLLDQILRKIHHAAIVRIGLVKLEHGELRIPAPAQPFVAKIPIDFVNPVKTSYGQPLQVELRRDPQIEVHVERVVVRNKRPRHGPAGDRLHHRSLYFNESLSIQASPQRLHQLAALQEHLPDLGIHHQV